jgi:hypothetical protein
MSPVTRRRLSRLEKLVTAERKQRKPLELAWRRQAARDHATKLVTLILHGDPHIEEPLAISWDRALDSASRTCIRHIYPIAYVL